MDGTGEKKSMNLINIGEETEIIEHKKSTGELKEGVISIASMLYSS